jgi:ribose transport system permease protein
VSALRRLSATLVPFAGLIAIAVALTIATDRFLTLANLLDVARRVSVINIIALGMTFVIITGGIDLSVGSIVALSGVAGTWSLTQGASIGAGVAIGVAVGAVAGLLNGALVAALHIPPFVATLGTMGALRGLALFVTNGVTVTEGVPLKFAQVADGRLLGIPYPVLMLVPLAFVAHGVLVRTPFGRYCYALGGNRQAGFLAGLSIPWILVSVYVISGATAGLAGMIDAARILTGNPTAGLEYELQVIAAVVIGGASLTGGKGTIIGATIGAVLMAVLQNGSNLIGISPFVQRMVIGALIVVAVGFDVWRERRSASSFFMRG